MNQKFGKWFRVGALLCICGFSAASASASEEYLIKFGSRVPESESLQILRASGLQTLRHFKEIGVYRAKVTDAKSFASHRKELEGRVAYIEKNGIVTLNSVPESALRAPEKSPNDKYLKEEQQVKLMHLKEAWDISTGSKSVVIGISDTGYNFKHPDLKNQAWTNPGEIPANKIDDEGNGFIDDVHGWAFDRKSADSSDTHGHGSHVAGIIGGEGDNKIGIVGVNWQVTMMPVRFIGGSGSGTDADGIETILYAANNGARLLNCSWSGSDPSKAMEDAINYGFSKGMLVIAAAGNESKSNDTTPSYPNSYDVPGVISVAALQWSDRIAYFSNLGQFRVDLAAPGQDILSSLHGKDYVRWSGTSMAAPMVTGIGALMLSVKPELTAMELRNGILNAVDQYENYAGLLATRGQANAYKALKQLSDGFQVWPQNLTIRRKLTYQFSAYNPNGAVTWKVTPETAATIDADGTLHPITEGVVEVSATDSTGTVAKTSHVELLDGIWDGEGCTKSAHLQQQAWPVQARAAASFALPFAFGFIAIRLPRRRRREDDDSLV